MTLEQVIELVIEELTSGGFTGPNALTEWEVYRIVRETWIEHRALPEMPVTMIIQRHLYRQTYAGERLFWNVHGLDPDILKR